MSSQPSFNATQCQDEIKKLEGDVKIFKGKYGNECYASTYCPTSPEDGTVRTPSGVRLSTPTMWDV